MARLTIRLDFETGDSIGPGKIGLLEAVARTGSIRKAAAEMDMGFRQAWLLLKALEGMFGKPLVETSQGGRQGGGSALTQLGREIVSEYREIETLASAAASSPLAKLELRVAEPTKAVKGAGAGKARLARRSLRRK